MSLAATSPHSVRIARLVREARTRARAAGARVLVSVVDRVRDVGPGAVLAAAAAIPNPAHAAPLAGDRMYWSRPDDGFALVGLAVAARLDVSTHSLTGAAAHHDRFTAVQHTWTALREHALVDDPSHGTEGAGPLLMGGFSFAPQGPCSTTWRDFPAASLILPRIQLAHADGECWLTTNLLVHPDGAVDVDQAALASATRRLIAVARREGGGAASRAPATAPAPLQWSDARPRAAWDEMVRDATSAIAEGALEKVVLAREVRVRAPRPFDTLAILRQLADAHPSCFVFGCWRGDSIFLGASPELLVRLAGGVVQASSLAGSAPRGELAAEDAALAAELLASAKNRREHEIVRRALCSALAELCDDVDAAAQPSLLTLPQLHHLHTEVRGRLRDERGHSLLDLVRRIHPTPAVGGEPREAALRFIAEHEQIDRGWYAAPIGWLQEGRGELAVALRSALVRGSEGALFAGCGIVADSDPTAEYDESMLKLRPMQAALAASVGAAPARRVEREGAAR